MDRSTKGAKKGRQRGRQKGLTLGVGSLRPFGCGGQIGGEEPVAATLFGMQIKLYDNPEII